MSERTISRTIRLPTAETHILARRQRLGNAILLEQVAQGIWRVCDSRRPSGSSGRFLGVIEERSGAFELMQQADTLISTRFDSMREALTFIVSTTDNVR